MDLQEENKKKKKKAWQSGRQLLQRFVCVGVDDDDDDDDDEDGDDGEQINRKTKKQIPICPQLLNTALHALSLSLSLSLSPLSFSHVRERRAHVPHAAGARTREPARRCTAQEPLTVAVCLPVIAAVWPSLPAPLDVCAEDTRLCAKQPPTSPPFFL